MIKMATTAINCVFDKKKNLEKYFKYIDEAAANGSNLVVFAEQSLQGYLTSLVKMESSDFMYQYKNAEIAGEGECFKAIMQKAKEKNIYIIFGYTEKDKEKDWVLYNSMALVGPEGLVGNYRKVHNPFDELHIYTPGNEFKVFDTSIGKIGMLICYDKSFPESTRTLALKGAEVIVMSTAWGYDTFESKPEDIDKDRAFYIYDLYDRVRALENCCYFISANQVGITGMGNYFGNSNIVNPRGEIVASTGTKEGIVYYETESIQEDRYDAMHVGFFGLNMIKDRRPIAYSKIAEPKEFYADDEEL